MLLARYYWWSCNYFVEIHVTINCQGAYNHIYHDEAWIIGKWKELATRNASWDRIVYLLVTYGTFFISWNRLPSQLAPSVATYSLYLCNFGFIQLFCLLWGSSLLFSVIPLRFYWTTDSPRCHFYWATFRQFPIAKSLLFWYFIASTMLLVHFIHY